MNTIKHLASKVTARQWAAGSIAGTASAYLLTQNYYVGLDKHESMKHVRQLSKKEGAEYSALVEAVDHVEALLKQQGDKKSDATDLEVVEDASKQNEAAHDEKGIDLGGQMMIAAEATAESTEAAAVTHGSRVLRKEEDARVQSLNDGDHTIHVVRRVTKKVADQAQTRKMAPVQVPGGTLGMKTNGFLFTSGNITIDPKNEASFNEDFSIEAQCELALSNLNEVLCASNCTKNDVIKTTVYLRDMNDFRKMNEIYAAFFDTHTPARTAVEVTGLPHNAKVGIEAIARLATRNIE